MASLWRGEEPSSCSSSWTARRGTWTSSASTSSLPDGPPTPVGPARSPEELAVDRLLALFGRALPRDFVDVFQLQERFGIEAVLRWAPEKDAGFSAYHLAEALGRLGRLPRTEFALTDDTYDDLLCFFADLRAELIRRTVED
jgi:hypothetical protein